MKFIIIGLGSIGQRHQGILTSLGHEVIPCHRGDDLKALISATHPDGVLICNPTSLHLKTAKAVLEFDLPLLIEKPLSHNLDGTADLKGKILVAYCLRFQPGLRQIKQQLTDRAIGKVLTAKIFCSTYLPEWHPGTDYTQSYSAKKSLGGGVLLDLSHEIDYAVWFFGRAKIVSAKLQIVPELKIETEAVADLEIEFVSGVTAQIHLDYVTKPPRRGCLIKGEAGNLSWQYPGPGNMYIDEIKHFIDIVKNQAQPLVPLADARHILEIIEAAKKSSLTGKIIKL
jgi:hypothetical protein